MNRLSLVLGLGALAYIATLTAVLAYALWWNAHYACSMLP